MQTCQVDDAKKDLERSQAKERKNLETKLQHQAVRILDQDEFDSCKDTLKLNDLKAQVRAWKAVDINWNTTFKESWRSTCQLGPSVAQSNKEGYKMACTRLMSIIQKFFAQPQASLVLLSRTSV